MRVPLNVLEVHHKTGKLHPSNCSCWFALLLQLANLERRLAKVQSGGSFSRARTYYRAAVQCLEAECTEAGTDSGEGQSGAEALELSSEDALRDTGEDATERQEARQLTHEEELPEEDDCRKTLVRALRSWGRTEGHLG